MLYCIFYEHLVSTDYRYIKKIEFLIKNLIKFKIYFTWWPRWFDWLPEWPPAIPWWWWYDDITSCLSWVSGPGDPVDPGPNDPLPWPPLPLPDPGDWWLWWWWCLPMSTAARTSALLSRPSLRPPNKSPYK